MTATLTNRIVLENCPADMESMRLLAIWALADGLWMQEECVGVAGVMGISRAEAVQCLQYVPADEDGGPAADELMVQFSVEPYLAADGRYAAGHIGLVKSEWERNSGRRRRLLEIRLTMLLLDMLNLRQSAGELVRATASTIPAPRVRLEDGSA